MHDTFHLAAEVINQMSLPLLHSSLSSPFSSEDKRAERSGNTGAYRMMTTTTTATMRRRRWRQRRDGEMIKRRWISCQPEFKVVFKKKNAQESSEPAEERRVQSASDSINFNQQEDENWKKKKIIAELESHGRHLSGGTIRFARGTRRRELHSVTLRDVSSVFFSFFLQN